MGKRLGTSSSDLVEEEEVRHVSGVVVAPMCLKAAKIVLHIIGGAYVSICASYTHNYRRRIMWYAPRTLLPPTSTGPTKSIGGAFSHVRLL